MKCGKKCEGNEVFCPECLEEMDRYPVKPGTVIQLPVRDTGEPRKPKKKKEVPLEEQIAALQKKIGLMSRWLLALILALIVTIGLLLLGVLHSGQTEAPAKKNYTTSAAASTDSTCFT